MALWGACLWFCNERLAQALWSHTSFLSSLLDLGAKRVMKEVLRPKKKAPAARANQRITKQTEAPRVLVPSLLMAISSLLRASYYLPSKPLREKKPSREDKTLEVNPRGDQPTDCGRNGPFFGPTCGSGQTILWRSRDRRLVSLSFACLEFSD